MGNRTGLSSGIRIRREFGLIALTAETKIGPISVPLAAQKKKSPSEFSVVLSAACPAVVVGVAGISLGII